MGEPALLVLVAVDASVWCMASAIVGVVAARMPRRSFERDTPLTAIRGVERDGALWRVVGVQRWKDALPEAGALFGGVSKRHLDGAASRGVLVAETRRAEWVHWVLVALSPAFAAWNPSWLALTMVAFAVAANLPCIIVQRYNRGRLLRVARRRRCAAGDRVER